MRWEAVTEPGALIAVGVALALVAAMHLVWRRLGRRPVIPGPFRIGADEERLARLYAIVPLILALHVAVPLVVSGVQMELFAPNLTLGGGEPVPVQSLWGALAALVEIGVGLALFYGAFTRAAAVALGLLWLAGAIAFGPVLLLEQAVFLGIAGTLFVTARGPYAVDRLLAPRLGLPRTALLPRAMALLRVGTGLSLVTLAFTEKLWNIPLALHFLERYPVNFTGTFGMPLSDTAFMYVAGTVELVAGLLLITNTFVRLGIVVLWFPFNLTLAVFGWRELVGHLPIYGAMATLAVWGAGSAADLRALRRGLEADGKPELQAGITQR